MNNGEQFFNTSAAGGYAIERSVRFNSADSAYLSRTPASAGNRKTWTWAGWVKQSGTGTILFSAGATSITSGQVYLGLFSNGILGFQVTESGVPKNYAPTALFRDCSAWYHIVAVFDSTQATASLRRRLYVNGIELTDLLVNDSLTQNFDTQVNNTTAQRIGVATDSGGALINYFNGYLADVHFLDGITPGTTTRVVNGVTETILTDFGEFDDNGIWQPIAYTGSYGTNGFHLPFSDNSTAAALGTDTSGQGNTWSVNNISVGSPVNYTTNIDLVNGDPVRTGNNIYNIFDGDTSTGAETDNGTGNSLLFDFANGTGSIPVSANIQVWVGGADGRTLKVNGSVIATNTGTGSNPHTITGQSQLDSVEVVSESATRSGYLLQISVDGTALVTNDPKNDDSLVDVPTNGTETDTGLGNEVRGNYCTWNPLAKGTDATLSNGNLDIAYGSSVTRSSTSGTFGVSTGKWYWEITVTASSLANTGAILGIANTPSPLANYPGFNSNGWGYEGNTGDKYNGSGNVSYGDTYGVGDVISVAFDADAGSLVFYKNGVSQGTAFTGLPSGTYFPSIGDGASTNTFSAAVNFGQRPFAYTAPSGFKALNTASLPAPVVTKPSEYMDVVTYTGNGSTQTISGLEFSPDLVWIKQRSGTNSHILKTIFQTKFLSSNGTEADRGNDGDLITSLDANGFTVNSTYLGAANASTNGSSQTYVAWTWDAGSSTVTLNPGDPGAGSITSQVRANPSAGFSIVTYTGGGAGSTMGHGLGVTPSLIIAKSRSSAGNWSVNGNFGGLIYGTNKLLLNTTDAMGGDTNEITAANSTTFTGGGSTATSGSGITYVAYCFAPVAGYSAMGSYVGNGNADGPFVFTGFRPRYIMVKKIDGAGSWHIKDTARDPSNRADRRLRADLSDAENTSSAFTDILSNGFKWRDTSSTEVNANGNTYLYYAVAENPFALNARAR